jgi:cytochrome P450
VTVPDVTPVGVPITHPITLGSPELTADPYGHYAWLRRHAPLYRGRMVLFGEADVWMVARYEDCRAVLTDPRFQRSPGGQGPGMLAQLPEPMREPMRLIAVSNMILMDDPGHRRLRRLVAGPFTPRAIGRIAERVRRLSHDLLDDLEPRGGFDLRREYALPVPSTVIDEMVGVPEADRARFRDGLTAMVAGVTELGPEGWAREMAAMGDLVRDLVEHKRSSPGEDILTGLIEAEEEGDRLSDDELVSMVFLLVGAGYETTYNLITNAVLTLLDHPDQLARLCAAPQDEALWRGAVEEIIRYGSPIGGTKPVTAVEDVDWHGTTIPAGSIVVPLLHSANRDPDAFEDPDRFDIDRHPNNHIGFGYGIHFCLGANLARMETRVALGVLFERNPGLRLAVDRDDLALEPLPLQVRYRQLPVQVG